MLKSLNKDFFFVDDLGLITAGAVQPYCTAFPCVCPAPMLVSAQWLDYISSAVRSVGQWCYTIEPQMLGEEFGGVPH